MDNVCIVPLRSGSKGLKDKNIKDFSGLPLYFWTIKKLYHLMKMGKVNKIIVSSDNDWYMDKVKLSFLNIMQDDSLILSKRPDELATSFTTTEEVCLHELDKHNINDGILSIVEVTSPLIPVDSLSFMMSILDDSMYSSFLVYKDIGQFWKCDKDNDYRWNKLYTDRKMRQEETEILYREVGAWSVRVDKFKQYKNRIIDASCTPVVIEKEFGISINDENDFYYAEYLIKQCAPQVFKETGLYK